MAKGFGGLPKNMNMQGLLKQAQAMQDKMQKAQEEAKLMTAEGTAGGGAVKVVANGDHQIVSITIDPAALSEAEVLQEMLLIASNMALSSVKDQMQKEMSKLTGGLNIPGM